MYNAILDEVVALFSAKGVKAVRSYPESRSELRGGALVCVAVKDARVLSSGMGEYLGRAFDSQGNDKGELYGLKLELVIGLDIFAPAGEEHGANECLRYYGGISNVLADFPSGLKVRELSCGAIAPDSLTEGYKCPALLHCTAHILGEADSDTGEFLDFYLKGVLKNG